MKSQTSCDVCGSTDTNLVDGFYYCVECGTQDTTIRETIVDLVEVNAGTLQIADKRKMRKIKPTPLQMSGEWQKWHAYNYMLFGIADELIGLGASPTFKNKLLWIWVLYIQKYHLSKEYNMNNLKKRNTILEASLKEDEEETINSDDDGENKTNTKKDNGKKSLQITIFTYKVMFSMIYCALNLDKSDIQASDLLRYIREGRISYADPKKYVPKELNLLKIPQWSNFVKSKIKRINRPTLFVTSKALFRELNLGTPLIPNMGMLVKRYCKELCLPNEFRCLVMSLMEYMPPEVMSENLMQFTVKMPDFEEIIMAFIVVGLKMCFGLDDDYDMTLTCLVNEINDEESHVKAYRIGLLEQTDRMFSFGEWVKYLEFRKVVLCKYYQPMAWMHGIGSNSCLIVESAKDLSKNEKKKAAEEIMVDLISKIPLNNDIRVIAKESFPASLTPLTAYTEYVLLNADIVPQIKLLLSEDFSKYSLRYACVDMSLDIPGCSENFIAGVTEINKILKDKIRGDIKPHYAKVKNHNTVLVKNGQSDDTLGHYLKLFFFKTFTEFEHEYDKSDPIEAEENVPIVRDISDIDELNDNENIFGVNFDVIQEETLVTDIHLNNLTTDLQLNNIDPNNSLRDKEDSLGNLMNIPAFDSHNFNREEVIKTLILRACAKYKIPIPYEYKSVQYEKIPKLPNENKNDPSDKKERERFSGSLDVRSILDLYKNSTGRDVAASPERMDIDSEINNGDRLNEVPNQTVDTVEMDTNLTTSILGQDLEVPDLNHMERTLSTPPLEEPNQDAIESNNMDFEEVQIDIDTKNVDDIIETEKKRLKIESENRKYEFEEEDDIPLSILFARQLLKKRKRSHLEPLVKNTDSFKYYFLHYYEGLTTQRRNFSFTYDKELESHFPNSYRYILRTCASILEATPFELHTVVEVLERNMEDILVESTTTPD